MCTWCNNTGVVEGEVCPNCHAKPQIKKGRTIKLVITDDGDTGFNFFAEGDIERIGKIDSKDYSAAEHWAVQFYALCQQQLTENKAIKVVAKEGEV